MRCSIPTRKGGPVKPGTVSEKKKQGNQTEETKKKVASKGHRCQDGTQKRHTKRSKSVGLCVA